MRLSDFDYHLPPSLIAQHPAEQRENARLMVLNKGDGSISHERFFNVVKYLRPGDALVMNDTRVTPSRLMGHRADTGGKVELLLISEKKEGEWESLIRPHKKGLLGTTILFGNGGLWAGVIELREEGRGYVRLSSDGPLKEKLLAYGKTPLPPYIRRNQRGDSQDVEMSDRERYQTVIARHDGSVAAPTAGLHFSAVLLEKLAAQGVKVVTITLHIGPGTFRPVRREDVVSHKMEAERFCVSPESAEEINKAKASGGRVVCVGSTAARTLETCAENDGRIEAGTASTGLFIYPGYDFKAVDALITNFHLPRSTLLLLVCAFAGRERTLQAYREAVAGGYRFYSYGDAMMII